MDCNLNELIPSDWYEALAKKGQLPALARVWEQVESARKGEIVYPPRQFTFRALQATPLASVRCIILGQDPYISEGQAMGLAFSVPEGCAIPPSLRNIFIELQREFGGVRRTRSDLSDWTAQGVLLLNSVLTVRAGQSASHSALGWQSITRSIVEIALEESHPKALLLWGQHAQKLVEGVPTFRNLVLRAAHPVAMTQYNSFLGCGHFCAVNLWLVARGEKEINFVG